MPDTPGEASILLNHYSNLLEHYHMTQVNVKDRGCPPTVTLWDAPNRATNATDTHGNVLHLNAKYGAEYLCMMCNYTCAVAIIVARSAV